MPSTVKERTSGKTGYCGDLAQLSRIVRITVVLTNWQIMHHPRTTEVALGNLSDGEGEHTMASFPLDTSD
jgi:hypothetical protein